MSLLDLLRGLVHDRGMAILLSSHLLTQVQSVCDRVGIFAAGKLIGQGTVDQLATRFGEDTAHVDVGLDLGGEAERRRAEAVLGGIDGVVGLEAGHDPDTTLRLAIRPLGAEPRVRQEVVAACAREGLQLTALRRVVPSLDDIYRRAVRRAGVAERPEAAA